MVLRLDADCTPGSSWVEAMGQAFLAGPMSARSPAARGSSTDRERCASARGRIPRWIRPMTAPALGHAPVRIEPRLRRSAWTGIRLAGRTDRIPSCTTTSTSPSTSASGSAFGSSRVRRWGSRCGRSRAASFAKRIDRGSARSSVHWPADFPPVRWTPCDAPRLARRSIRDTPAAHEGPIIGAVAAPDIHVMTFNVRRRMRTLPWTASTLEPPSRRCSASCCASSCPRSSAFRRRSPTRHHDRVRSAIAIAESATAGTGPTWRGLSCLLRQQRLELLDVEQTALSDTPIVSAHVVGQPVSPCTGSSTLRDRITGSVFTAC